MRLRRRTGETNLDAHILVLQEQGDRRSLHWSHVREPERVHYLQRHGGKRRLDRPERQHGKVGGGEMLDPLASCPVSWSSLNKDKDT